MSFNLQPILHNDLVKAIPLLQDHFEVLYKAASDPLIWEQHPNKNRYQLKDFTNYFEGAIKSGGAFLILDAISNEVIGSTRYSSLLQNDTESRVDIGYTFYVRSHWGKGHNHSMKRLMMQHAFQYVQQVRFIIGIVNKRSQISIERLGAIKIATEEVAYYGEPSQLNYIYTIKKEDFK